MYYNHTSDTYDNQCSITSDFTLLDTIKLNSNTSLTLGIDEVGRGSLFGHMSICGVILPNDLTGELDKIDLNNTPLKLINDSKKLTEKRREQLYDEIDKLNIALVIVDVPHYIIDLVNIRQATLLGMRLIIEQVIQEYPSNLLNVLIDGNDTPKLSKRFERNHANISTLVKGDAIHSSIACASIMAKVHRDRQMQRYDALYPEYKLGSNKGYGSKAHREAIENFGVLPEHRQSFEPIRSLL